MRVEELRNMTWNDICLATFCDPNKEVITRLQIGKDPGSWLTLSASNYTGLYVIEKSAIDITEEYQSIACCLDEAWEIIKGELL